MAITWEDASELISEDEYTSQASNPLDTGHSGIIRIPAKMAETDSNTEINEAMNRYAAGEMDAFSELYDLIAPRLYGYLFRKTRNQSLAEDLLQQTMLRIHCARGRFIRGAQVMPWLISIARRLLIDGMRHAKVECCVDAEDNLAAQLAMRALDRPADEVMHTKQVAQMVLRELAQLPESQRAAFELVKQDGLSHAEAAQILGTTVTAVKLRSHRTYVKLRSALNNLLETKDL